MHFSEVPFTENFETPYYFEDGSEENKKNDSIVKEQAYYLDLENSEKVTFRKLTPDLSSSILEKIEKEMRAVFIDKELLVIKINDIWNKCFKELNERNVCVIIEDKDAENNITQTSHAISDFKICTQTNEESEILSKAIKQFIRIARRREDFEYFYFRLFPMPKEKQKIINQNHIQRLKVKRIVIKQREESRAPYKILNIFNFLLSEYLMQLIEISCKNKQKSENETVKNEVSNKIILENVINYEIKFQELKNRHIYQRISAA